MERTLIILSALTILSSVTVAQDTDDDKPPIHKIIAKPAAEPVPALRYQLLPTLLEQKPGNAALLYYKVLWLETPRPQEERDLAEKLSDWISTPLDKLPLDDVRRAMEHHASRHKRADVAARRQYCDWELPFRDGHPWEMLLPEAQGARELGRVLAVRARLAIVEHRYDDAIHDLQTGFALARHIAAGPTLVNGLVGLAICSQMLEQVEALVQAPGAPNVYWALMALPRPMIDLRTAMDYEMQWVAFAFPQLYDAESSGRTVGQWRKIIADVQETSRRFMSDGKFGWQTGMIEAAAAVKSYPEAKRYLVSEGRSPAEVDAMPVGEALAIYTRDKFHQLRDDQYKWTFVPYSQRGEGLARADEALKRAAREPDMFHFDTLISAIDAATIASLRNDRRIAALSVLEGLRMYAAAHGGRLPERLADMTDSPALADPLTGQPFTYRVVGNTATLEAPAPRGRPPKYDAIHYELTIEP